MTDKRQKTTTKERSRHRLKIILGHVKALEKMVENDNYCIEVVHQSIAIQKALKKLDLLIIENHLKGCVVHQIKDGKEDKATSELLRLYEYK